MISCVLSVSLKFWLDAGPQAYSWSEFLCQRSTEAMPHPVFLQGRPPSWYFCGPSPCPFVQPAGIGTWLRRAVCILHQFGTGRNKPWGLILNCNGHQSWELFAIQLRDDVWKLGVNLLYPKECFGLCSLRREDPFSGSNADEVTNILSVG